MSHACHRFWKCYKSLTFCSLLKRCTIPSACRAKRQLNVQKCSVPVSFSPHHCVGFMFFAWIPPLPVPAAPAAPSSQITPHSSNHTSLNSSQLQITAPLLTIHSSQLNSSQLPITAPLITAPTSQLITALLLAINSSQLFSWQAQYTEPPGQAAARVAAAGPRLPFISLITAPLLTPHPSQLHCSSQLITAPLLTGPLLITSHRSTSQHNSSQLITSQLLITTHHHLSHPNSWQLHFSHHFSHLTYRIRTHHSSTSHTWHHKSTSHTSLLTPPRSSH